MARIDLTAASISASVAMNLLLKPASATAMGGVLVVSRKSGLRPSAFDRNARTSVLDVAPRPFELPAAVLGIGLLPRRIRRVGREDGEGFGRGLRAVVRHELPPRSAGRSGHRWRKA